MKDLPALIEIHKTLENKETEIITYDVDSVPTNIIKMP